MAASKIRIRKICEYCGQEFYALKTSTRFCSKSCNDRAYKMRQRVNTVKKAESENLTVSQEHTFIWGIERSGFFNGREKWAKGFENQRV